MDSSKDLIEKWRLNYYNGEQDNETKDEHREEGGVAVKNKTLVLT